MRDDDLEYYLAVRTANGELRTFPHRVRTVKYAPEEDWKTALAQGIKPIPYGTELNAIGVYRNLYGTFLEVEYNGRCYTIAPRCVEIID